MAPSVPSADADASKVAHQHVDAPASVIDAPSSVTENPVAQPPPQSAIVSDLAIKDAAPSNPATKPPVARLESPIEQAGASSNLAVPPAAIAQDLTHTNPATSNIPTGELIAAEKAPIAIKTSVASMSTGKPAEFALDQPVSSDLGVQEPQDDSDDVQDLISKRSAETLDEQATVDSPSASVSQISTYLPF